jgi:hypothetical protein
MPAMSDAPLRPADRAEAIANYKRILRTYIDRRPSGTRQKIALTLGKHKSFVSQITNPVYASPVPAPHLNAIFEICHFSPEERKTFLGAYRAAHPKQVGGAPVAPSADKAYDLRIRVPVLADARLQKELEATIRQTASRIIALVARR